MIAYCGRLGTPRGQLIDKQDENCHEVFASSTPLMEPLAASCASPFPGPAHRIASQRRTARAFRLQSAGEHRQNRVAPRFVMVVQVLVARRDANDALHHQGLG